MDYPLYNFFINNKKYTHVTCFPIFVWPLPFFLLGLFSLSLSYWPLWFLLNLFPTTGITCLTLYRKCFSRCSLLMPQLVQFAVLISRSPSQLFGFDQQQVCNLHTTSTHPTRYQGMAPEHFFWRAHAVRHDMPPSLHELHQGLRMSSRSWQKLVSKMTANLAHKRLKRVRHYLW